MKLTEWSFNGLSMPMIEDNNGTLYCTTKQLAVALGKTEKHIHDLKKLHEDELVGINPDTIGAKGFLSANKEELGIKRVRDNMSLWTEDEMILIAMLSRSTVSKEFRRELVKFVKANARRGYVTNEMFEIVQGRLENLESLVLPLLEQQASHAGRTLQDYKSVRQMQVIH